MENLIENFYSAMQDKNAEEMIMCYHQAIEFYDPAFGRLMGKRAGDMWRMLMASQNDTSFRVEYSDLSFQENRAFGRLDAYYQFGKSKRPVHNIIYSEFLISEGKIIQHTDRFNLYRWSRQALGITGWLIGWTSWFSNKMKKRSNYLLDKWINKHGGGSL